MPLYPQVIFKVLNNSTLCALKSVTREMKTAFGLQLTFCNFRWRGLGRGVSKKGIPILINHSLFQNNGKAGYNVGDKLDSNPGDNIQEFRQLPMVLYQ